MNKDMPEKIYVEKMSRSNGGWWCYKNIRPDKQKKYLHAEKTKTRLIEALEQAYMAGQAEEGIDPSYSNAQRYAERVINQVFNESTEDE